MQSTLWGEVQGKITVMSDQMLEEVFEVNVTREKLKDDQRSLQQIMAQFQEQEQSFLEAANTFSHPAHGSLLAMMRTAVSGTMRRWMPGAPLWCRGWTWTRDSCGGLGSVSIRPPLHGQHPRTRCS
eukprot:TRINITY_DN4367_c1_g1_i1.p1 TRINITY_DN4367_c1_g1~~TRINITY_DN4367_c1_g1_i1.p1  ORF type:complete len:126 (+),score=19.43 TRINITY_DN4367_c1_g1_i1:163-540(+)